MSHRDVVFPAGRQALYARNRYSPAIRCNGLLFVSGQVGSREDGSPEPEFAAQVRRAFDNLNAVLAAAGCTFDDVIDVTVFLVDPERNFATAWAIVPEYWGEAPHPTLTGVGVTWLYGFQFEIKVIAKLP
ncbi:RidA family protein [Xanthomonas sp. LMG 8992]|uniref:RidA family protein n=1 Tax=Xanthomonas sp. LMG 8992 TaxID=1591157 RepID=UPI00136A6CC1|nr:RidA family protein [Xanthomonas sp. LMG 8992]MXV11609.1 RidA family protein [Xanthomonas sp. LMG 8992]